MKKGMADIIPADDPERYLIRYSTEKGKKRIVNLQMNEDNESCILIDSPDTNRSKSKCIVHFEGYVEDFCMDHFAVIHGMLFPDVALLRWFNKNAIHLLDQ